MRSQLAFTMGSMYGRDGTSAYRYSCQKEYPKFSFDWNERAAGRDCDACMAAGDKMMSSFCCVGGDSAYDRTLQQHVDLYLPKQ